MFQLDRVELLLGGGVALASGAELPALGPLPPAVRDLPDQFRLGALGLTIGSAVGAIVEYRLLRELVERRVAGRVRIGGPTRGRLLAAGAVAAVAAVLVRPVATELTPVLGGTLAVVVVAVAHIGAALALGLDEARALWASASSRLVR